MGSLLDSLPTVQHITALPGRGVQAQRADGRPLFLVNLRWAQEQGLATPALAAIVQAQAAQGRSISLLATPQQVLAWFAVADPLRPQAKAAVAQLQALGVKTVISLRSFHSDTQVLDGSGIRAVRIPINTWAIRDRHVIETMRAIHAAGSMGPCCCIACTAQTAPA